MKKKNGFTLIELLAVIIILGILMIIAIPSVTKYINDSRKSAYIDTAKEVIGSARNLVNDGKLEMYDTDTTYYIDIECIKAENSVKSPYGEFVDDRAYVVVTFDGKGYEYFWTSIDDAGQGIKDIVRIDKLDTDNIESDLSPSDITTDKGINGRNKYMIINNEQTSCGKGFSSDVSSYVSGETGKEFSVTYPEGKNKSTVVVGDLVKVDSEEFYVISNNGTDLVLLAKYNLKVGNIMNGDGTFDREILSSEDKYGLQSSECKGIQRTGKRYCTLAFNDSYYWAGKVGEGLTYEGSYSINDYPFVYDSNCLLYKHVENYKKELNKIGLYVKSARIIKSQELQALGCKLYPDWNCNSAPSFVYDTSYWVGSVYSDSTGLLVQYNGNFTLANVTPDNNARGQSLGVRPVIVI